jgi:hypothetical protein
MSFKPNHFRRPPALILLLEPIYDLSSSKAQKAVHPHFQAYLSLANLLIFY